MAALYVLNIYNNENIYSLDKDSSGSTFDLNVGSDIFSVKLHANQGVSVGIDYSKNDDYEECIYLLKPTDETRNELQQKLKEINDITLERTKANLLEQITKELNESKLSNQEEVNDRIKSITEKINTENMIQVAKENGLVLKNKIENLKYEAILNTHQF